MKLKNEIIKDTDPFVPLKTGILKNSAIRSVQSNDDNIIYKTPYARFLYYGKSSTGENLTFSRPTACSFWFERSKSLYKDKWINVVKKVYR